MSSEPLSLLQFNSLIKSSITNSLPDTYPVVAEIAQLKVNYSGHCYLELIEKNKKTDKIAAQAKAVIWGSTYRMLKPYFETSTGHSFTEGLKVLLHVKAEFHEIYGLSLVVYDIDPEFTVGDLTLKRNEIINKLKSDGIFDMNKELEFPLVPQRIAVISSETAAGYGDFTNQINDNSYNYVFHIQLFPAFMQGEKTEESVINALDQIYNQIEDFDTVAIIRGGGSQTDLSWFDNYAIASHVAQFPIPVITGIGHEQDDSITDMVAHIRLKTPTAVAEFLIQQVANFENTLDDIQSQMISTVTDLISYNSQALENLCKSFPMLIKERVFNNYQLLNGLLYKSNMLITKTINKHNEHLNNTTFQMQIASTHFFKSQSKQIRGYYESIGKRSKLNFSNNLNLLTQYQKTISLIDPSNILKKGYSITLINNKPLKNTDNLNEGDVFETLLHKGKFKGKVLSKS
jgi:exodeoxyribonuclease VII large subunit